MKLPVGTRVRVKLAPTAVERTGEIVRGYAKNCGYGVKLDPPKLNAFEPDTIRVYGNSLTPVDPKLHERYEKSWETAPFVDRAWAR